MGGHPLHGPGPGGVTVPGGANIDVEAPAAVDRWEMGIHLGGGSKGGVRIWGDGRVHSEKEEHGRTFHSYAIAYGPMWVDGEDIGGAGGDVVVGAGRTWPGSGNGDGVGGGGSGQGVGWKSGRGKRGRLLGWDSGREYKVSKLTQ